MIGAFGGRVAILVALRLGRHAAERAFRQVVALARQTVAGGVDPLLDTSASTASRVLVVSSSTSLTAKRATRPDAGWPAVDQR